MGAFLYLLVAVIGFGYLWIKKQFNYWTDRGFVSPPSTIPFGSLKGVGTKITNAEGMDKIYKEYKGKASVVGTYFFLKPTILTIDPEVYKNIMVRDFSSFHDRGFYYNKEDDPTSAK